MFNRAEFMSLVKFLRDNGYDVEIKEKTYRGVKNINLSAIVRCRGIFGAFSYCKTDEGCWYSNLFNRFAADNAETFNKYSQCPMVIALPHDKADILRQLKYLAGDEAEELSNGFDVGFGILSYDKYERI